MHGRSIRSRPCRGCQGQRMPSQSVAAEADQERVVRNVSQRRHSVGLYLWASAEEQWGYKSGNIAWYNQQVGWVC